MSVESIVNRLGAHFLNFTEHGLVYGPQGRMLLRNIENLWFLHCVTMARYNVFLCSMEKFTSTLKNYKTDIPVGIAVIENSKNIWNQSSLPSGCKMQSHKVAKINIIDDNSRSTDLFQQKQRERKVWWRKLAQYPSRFVLTEKKKTKSRTIMDLEVQFPFGNIIVETLSHHYDIQKLFTQEDTEEMNVTDMHMIEHVVSLDWGCVALLCDTLKSNDTTELFMHPKISPYKVAFCIPKLPDENNLENEEVNRFILYLNNIVRANGFDTIVTSMEQVIEMCLVPFTVTADKTSLKNGIIHVTSCSTTLAEAVHVTDLVKYIASRC